MPHLLALVGPTASGKTEVAIEVAKHFGTEIISADSRQVFRELNIGVASPTEQQLAEVPHHYIKSRSITESYSAGQYADDVLQFLVGFFPKNPFAILVGGSGLYVKAACEGFDDVPPSDREVREELNMRFNREGLTPLLQQLQQVDPDYFASVDRANPRRVLRALEVFTITGKPFSAFRKSTPAKRPFDVLKIGLAPAKEELAQRIEQRVDHMISQGLLAEARTELPFRHLPALQTVGYRELFEYFDGKTTLDEAVALIKKHSIQFAKHQMTWWRKDKSIAWFHPTQYRDIVARIGGWLGSSKNLAS